MAHIKNNVLIEKQRFGLYKNPTQSMTFYNLALGGVTIVYAYTYYNVYKDRIHMETRGLVTQSFNMRLL